jgi:hypothetical protein
MSEMSAGIRALEMHERQTWQRERAHRELVGQVTESGPRLKLFRRTTRRAA